MEECKVNPGTLPLKAVGLILWAGAMGLMSTSHSCVQLLQCNESLVHLEERPRLGTLL